MRDDEAWFAPKSFGYGAGLPIRWQGWALMVGYILLIMLATLVLPYTVIGYVSILVILSVPFLIIVAQRTEGGWRWRSGGED